MTVLEKLLTEKELSRWLGLSLPTLQRLRCYGGGPRFVRLSLRRIGYRRVDVEVWLASRTAEQLQNTAGSDSSSGCQSTAPADRAELAGEPLATRAAA